MEESASLIACCQLAAGTENEADRNARTPLQTIRPCHRATSHTTNCHHDLQLLFLLLIFHTATYPTPTTSHLAANLQLNHPFLTLLQPPSPLPPLPHYQRPQCNLQPSPARLPRFPTSSQARLARAGQSPRDEGRMSQGGHDEAEEAQFGREENGPGEAEQWEGRHLLYPRRRCVTSLVVFLFFDFFSRARPRRRLIGVETSIQDITYSNIQ